MSYPTRPLDDRLCGIRRSALIAYNDPKELMRKLIIAVAALAALVVPTAAMADVSTNGTVNDAYGYCQANHIANFNGDHNGIGWIRSGQTGAQISDAAGNRAPVQHCVDTQGNFAPISNNG